MSTLLEQASLVMIPSGYKEDVVYSQIPTDGSGDLSFTRASNGTRVNSAGLVEVCPWNLFTYSNDFSNSAWTKYNASLTSGQSDPFGGNNAWKFQAIVSAQSDFRQTVTGASSYSFYAKAGSVSEFRLWSGSAGTIFDTSTGTVASGSGTIESVGNGWYRCTILTSTTGSVTLIPYFVGDANDYIYIAFGQAQASTTAKPYFPTTDRLNVPRLTYQNGGGGCPSLLLEKQSTNLVTYSEDFTQWSAGNVSVTANNTTSPDGTQNADLLTADGQNIQHYVQKGVAQSNKTYSVFAKMGTQRYIQILTSGSAAPVANFDLQDGVANMIGSNSVASIENYGNGWYRCILQTNDVLAGDFYVNYASSLTMGRFGATTTSNTLYIWGGQAESGTYPTSYIPTTSSSATRVADACFKTGISSLIGQTEGTIFVDLVYNGSEAQTGNILSFDQSTSGSVVIIRNANGSIGTAVWDGSAKAVFNGGSMPIGQRTKIAYAYKSGSTALFVNGVQIGSDSGSTFTLPTISQIYLNSVTAYFAFQQSASFNESVLFKTRLTNAELASLTTI